MDQRYNKIKRSALPRTLNKQQRHIKKRNKHVGSNIPHQHHNLLSLSLYCQFLRTMKWGEGIKALLSHLSLCLQLDAKKLIIIRKMATMHECDLRWLDQILYKFQSTRCLINNQVDQARPTITFVEVGLYSHPWFWILLSMGSNENHVTILLNIITN